MEIFAFLGSKFHENQVFHQPRPGNARGSSAGWLKVKQAPRDVTQKRFQLNRSSHRGDICIFTSKIHENPNFHQPRPGNARESSSEQLKVKQAPRDVTQKRFQLNRTPDREDICIFRVEISRKSLLSPAPTRKRAWEHRLALKSKVGT